MSYVCVCVFLCVCFLCVCVFYLDHWKQGAGKHPPELSSDVHHVHLAATHHHSDQGVVIGSCTLKQTHKHMMTHNFSLSSGLSFLAFCWHKMWDLNWFNRGWTYHRLYSVGHFRHICLSYLHCIVQGLCKIGWDAPGTLHFKRRTQKTEKCVSQSHNLSRIWARNQTKWRVVCVVSYPRPAAGLSGVQMFPSWCSPPSRIQTTSCKHQILKHTQVHNESKNNDRGSRILSGLWDEPFLRCSALRFPRMVTKVCSSVPNFFSPASKRTYNHRNRWCTSNPVCPSQSEKLLHNPCSIFLHFSSQLFNLNNVHTVHDVFNHFFCTC